MRKKSKMRAYAFLMAMVLAITTFLGDASAVMPAYAAGENAQELDDKFLPDTLSREGEPAAQEMTIAEWSGMDDSVVLPNTVEKDGVVVGIWGITSRLKKATFSTTHGYAMQGWNVTDTEVNSREAWSFTFNAEGYTNLKFSAIQRSSNAGPKNFMFQYSLENSEEIIDIGTVYQVVNAAVPVECKLPEEVYGKKFTLYIRNVDAERASGTGEPSGFNHIRNISLTGTIMSGSQIVTPEEGKEVQTIATVKSTANSEETSMVKGRLIFKEGGNYYLQDETGGLVVSFKNALANPNPVVGDLLQVTGTYGKENGLHMLKEADLNGLEKSEEALPSATKTLADILGDSTDALQATRVRVESVTLGAKDASGSTTLTQGEQSIKVYNMPSLTDIVEHDIVTVDAVVSKNENEIQLRVASAADVTLVKHIETCGEVTASVKNGYVDPNTEVTLSCATEGAAIHYSIDDKKTYQEYSSPIVITKDTTIYAYATKEGYIDGSEKSFNYLVDTEFVQPEWNESIRVNIAQWAGNADYDTAGVNTGSIKGDLFAPNDLLDADSLFSATVNGQAVKPYMTPTTAGAAYYMGGQNLGSGTDDYIQLALSSAGFTNMKLSFRMRATKAAAGAFQLQYSRDGQNFKDFTTGTYEYKYTAYGSGGVSSDVEGSGEITDGVARPSLAPANYVSFSFDVPARATNTKRLYIRMVPGKDKADGSGTVTAGNIRVDSVVLSGNPIMDDTICKPVIADPAEQEVPMNSPLTLTSETEGAEIYYSLNNGEFVKYDESKKPVLTEFPVNLRAYASKAGMTDSGKLLYQYTQAQVSTVRATPNGGAVAAGTVVKLNCNTEGAKIYTAKQNADETWGEWTEVPDNHLTLTELPAVYKVKATKEGYLDSSELTISYTLRENEKYNIYFGQMHSHTSYSDGAGTAEEAYQHGKAVENLDFLSLTDHSNSFDNADAASILDGSVSTEWTEGHQLEEKYTSNDFVGIFGYEMTWSNGLGHMNTFNSGGFQSRTQTEFATYSTALQNYYAALKTQPNSISQFNHPGTTFGDFSDFAHYDETIDNLITLIEVGNGEGAIGSSGYFPSYEYYQRALDKGWHVAPTNNQDNHKGRWGDANTARSVVLADSLTRNNIYDAMRNNRVYATEDNDLSIYYTLDGYEMGTVLEEGDTGETVHLKAELSDPTDAGLGTVSVITNGGLVLDKKTITGNTATVEFDIDNKYSYYYLKVVEADGDIAVTAPVWVGSVEEAGINKLSSSTKIPLKGKPLDINLELYNNEKTDMEVQSIEFKAGDEVIHTVALEAGEKIASGTTKTYSFDYTYNKAGGVQVTAEVRAKLNGVDKVYGSSLSLFYILPELVTKIVIDGTHSNDYVSGNYADYMGNFAKIAEALNSNNNMEVHVEKNQITSEMLSDCALLVITPPAKKAGSTYGVSHFDDAFVQMVKDYTDKGGALIVCGASDYQDTTDVQTAKEMNKILTAIGATTRMNSDQVQDSTKNEKEPYRLSLKNFNAGSKYLKGAFADSTDEEGNKIEGQEYSTYRGCSVALDPDAVTSGKAEPLVSGFDTTSSVDCKDENGASVSNNPTVVEAGKVVSLGHETLTNGADIFVAGTVFMSDYEVKAEEDTVKPFLNKTILENILRDVQVALPVTEISQMRQGEMGELFTIEGYVTAGTAVKGNIFFDTIYLQDDTAGVTVFPYAQEGLEVGTKIQATGYVDAYQGDKELQLLYTKILDAEPKVYEPQAMSAKDAMDYEKSGGKLVKVEGKVTDVLYDAAGTGVSQFWVDDGSGEIANVFIDGYILSAETQKNELASVVEMGATVSAAGLVYAHPEGESDVPITCLRVRNCDEIVQTVPPVEATGITLDKTTGSIKVGETLTLTATVEPEAASDTVVWMSSDDTVATVKHGVVTGVKAGTAVITAKAGDKTATCTITVTDADTPPTGVTGITLDKASASVQVGKTVTLTATVEPAGIEEAVVWKSSDNTIATVENGVVTGVKAGTATITAEAGGKTATCKVTVTDTPPVEVTGITLNKLTGSVQVGGTLTLTATVEPAGATDAVLWESSDPAIATVEDGVVTGVKAGTVDITAEAGSKKATCKVTVTDLPPVEITGITLNKLTGSVQVGKTLTLIATVEPAGATDAVIWESSDPTIATVKDGVVTGVKAGTVDITAEAGSKKATCKVTVTDTPPVEVTGITLNKLTGSVQVGGTLTLIATVEPAGATDAVIWESSDPTIATVKDGVVTGVKAGTVDITAEAGSKKATCKVTVTDTPPVEVTGITLDKTAGSIKVGETLTLKATVEPAGATDAVIWESSEPAIAAVKDGVVTGVKEGTADITAEAGSKKAVCRVTVTADTTIITPPVAVTGITLDKTNASIGKGKTFTLKAAVAPADAANKTVVWSSSNPKVATVTNAGVVKGIKAGTASITAEAGGKKAVCKVKVGTVALNYKTLTMKKGTSTKALTAKYTNDAYKKWKSSNSKVVKVTVKKGKVTLKAVKKGTATITVTSKLGVTAKCKVKVQTKDVKTKKLALNKKKAALKVKKSLQLKVTRTPVTASDKVTWSTSNKKVAVVSKKGKVTAKKAGKATITVKANGKKASCKITVKK